jgi:hypothetical protein
MRTCGWCLGSLEGMRPHAIYCGRSCKSKASNRRLRDTGVLRERDRARYTKEAEHRRAYARKYLTENPERMRAIRRNRKSRIKAQRFEFTEKDWRRACARTRGCCTYCGVKPEGPLQREHVIPIVRDGRHSVGNIVPACAACNYSKKDKLLSEWRYKRGGGGSHLAPTRNPSVQRRARLHRPDVAA